MIFNLIKYKEHNKTINKILLATMNAQIQWEVHMDFMMMKMKKKHKNIIKRIYLIKKISCIRIMKTTMKMKMMNMNMKTKILMIIIK